MRPMLFLDTSVCIEAAKRGGKITPEIRRRIRERCRRDFRYAISYTTVEELLVKLSRGVQTRFEQNKEPIRFLIGGGRIENLNFLKKGPIFAVETILGIKLRYLDPIEGRAPLTQQAWSVGVVKAVLRAREKATLKSGVRVNAFGKTHITFDLDDLDNVRRRQQAQHAELLTGIRTGEIRTGDPTTMSAWLLNQMEVKPDKQWCSALNHGLDSAWRYALRVCGQANNHNFDFRANLSDWDDINQLMYLSHPDMYMLSLDRDFCIRASGGWQSARILSLDRFLASTI